jgi:hypothetical protein
MQRTVIRGFFTRNHKVHPLSSSFGKHRIIKRSYVSDRPLDSHERLDRLYREAFSVGNDGYISIKNEEAVKELFMETGATIAIDTVLKPYMEKNEFKRVEAAYALAQMEAPKMAPDEIVFVEPAMAEALIVKQIREGMGYSTDEPTMEIIEGNIRDKMLTSSYHEAEKIKKAPILKWINTKTHHFPRRPTANGRPRPQYELTEEKPYVAPPGDVDIRQKMEELTRPPPFHYEASGLQESTDYAEPAPQKAPKKWHYHYEGKESDRKPSPRLKK